MALARSHVKMIPLCDRSHTIHGSCTSSANKDFFCGFGNTTIRTTGVLLERSSRRRSLQPVGLQKDEGSP